MAELATLARPYAKAFFEIHSAAGSLAAGESALDALAQVVTHDQVSPLLGNPKLSGEQVAELVIAAMKDQADDTAKALVRVLVDNDRLRAAPHIAEQYRAMKQQAESRISVEIVAARDVAGDTRQALETALKTRLQRDVDLTIRVDENLIGGAVIRAGDLVIDGSVRGELARIAQSVAA